MAWKKEGKIDSLDIILFVEIVIARQCLCQGASHVEAVLMLVLHLRTFLVSIL